jgi:hypothetical protein
MGDVSDLHPFIPCKVPLGQRWAELVAPHGFTPADACALAHSKLEAFAAARHAATVRSLGAAEAGGVPVFGVFVGWI